MWWMFVIFMYEIDDIRVELMSIRFCNFLLCNIFVWLSEMIEF